MTTEKEFIERYKDYSKDQLLQLAYINLVKAEQSEENYKALAKRFFGPRSEKINPDQLSLFNEAELTAEAEPEKTGETETVACTRKKGIRNSGEASGHWFSYAYSIYRLQSCWDVLIFLRIDAT